MNPFHHHRFHDALTYYSLVLFYVDEDAVRHIMDELFSFASAGGNGSENPRAETMLCFTDSLKPFVDVPFSNEAMEFFEQNGAPAASFAMGWCRTLCPRCLFQGLSS
mmetsp:Transcript_3185/g.8794  ORF Transcript_3185/g.8794 Transcript_3185/m.8794 type:complete len:107 (+) Transcript_3185:1350-1670(+)